MTDLDKALAAAREAAGMALFDDSPKAKHACVEALHDLLAALDAARGDAVAWVDADTLAEVKPQYVLRTSLYGSNASGDRIPLYTAPLGNTDDCREEAAPAAPAAAVPVRESCGFTALAKIEHAAQRHVTRECREAVLTEDECRALLEHIDRMASQAPPAAAVPAGYVPVSALIEAREEVEDWAAYAPFHFREKHDLAGTLAKMDAQIAAAQAQQPAAAVPGGYNEDEIADACMMAEVSDSKYVAIIAYLADNRRAMLAAARKGGES